MCKFWMKKLLIVTFFILMMTFVGCGKKDEADTAAGPKSFVLTVTDKEGKDTTFNITTEKKTVGEALIDEGIIEGDEGEYGLYVTKVNGVEAIYEDDGTYWAFYVNGEYATAGVDTTDVTDGENYGFKIEGN